MKHGMRRAFAMLLAAVRAELQATRKIPSIRRPLWPRAMI